MRRHGGGSLALAIHSQAHPGAGPGNDFDVFKPTSTTKGKHYLLEYKLWRLTLKR